METQIHNKEERRRICSRRRIWPKKKNLNNHIHFSKTQTQQKKKTHKCFDFSTRATWVCYFSLVLLPVYSWTIRIDVVISHRKAGMMNACKMQTILTELWGWTNLVLRWDNYLDSLKLVNSRRIFWCFCSFFEGIVQALENQSLDFFVDANY